MLTLSPRSPNVDLLPSSIISLWVPGRPSASATEPAQRPGVEAVLIPGDPEVRARREREAHGIPLDQETIEQLTALGVEAGTAFPAARA